VGDPLPGEPGGGGRGGRPRLAAAAGRSGSAPCVWVQLQRVDGEMSPGSVSLRRAKRTGPRARTDPAREIQSGSLEDFAKFF